jgi:hypothetical protein
MEHNKASKYFKYAIGEIILVVIGILIALQINNWNEDSKNSSKEHEYLIGLKNDLEKQIGLFKNNSTFYNRILSTAESILVDYSKANKLMDIDSINKKLSFMMYTRDYPEINTTFNELNATGQLNLIKGTALRTNIIKYYQNSQTSKQRINSNTDDVIYQQIFPILKASVIINPEDFNFSMEKVDYKNLRTKLNPTLETILDNSNKEFEIINAVNLRIIVTKTNQGSLKNVQNEAELLLLDIYNALKTE